MHFYNEEYLLPFWIEYHSKLPIDNVVLIDYHSTDRSVEIIKEQAPSHWRLLTSRNENFDVLKCDQEVMDIEEGLSGWKIALNTTEFLLCPSDIHRALKVDDRVLAHACPSVIITGKEHGFTRFPKAEVRMSKHPSDAKELFRGFKEGVFCDRLADDGDALRRPPRYIHNAPHGNYSPGRHRTNNRIYTSDLFYVGWLGYFPWNQRVRDRKLQIKSQIPQADIEKQWGHQHFWTDQQLYNVRHQLVQYSENLLETKKYDQAYTNVLSLL